MSDLKTTKGGLGGAHLSNPVFGRKREEKRKKSQGKVGDQGLVGFASHFLILRDRATKK